jgi:hypothetical protein
MHKILKIILHNLNTINTALMYIASTMHWYSTGTLALQFTIYKLMKLCAKAVYVL